MKTKINLAIGVSGGGTTFEAIAKAIIAGDIDMSLAFVFADRECGALKLADELGIRALIRTEGESIDIFHERILAEVDKENVDVVALAGYLRNFPITNNDKFLVINSHPGAIPYFGGKGMYGRHVHVAVHKWIVDTERKHPYTYSTVHVATEVYDEGQKLGIVQMKVTRADTPDTIAAKLLPLEHRNYIQTLKDIANVQSSAKAYPESFEEIILIK